MEFIEKLLESLLLFRRPFQLQKHVLHREIFSDGAAVVCKDSFGARVAAQGDAICFINAWRDSRASVRAGLQLSENRGHDRQDGEKNNGDEPGLAKHGSPS